MASFYGGVGISGGSGGGSSGVGIATIEFDENRNLIIYLSDGTKKNLGIIDGATYTPKVVDGVISWTNDKNLVNPDSYDITAGLDGGEYWEGVQGESEQPADDNQYWESI